MSKPSITPHSVSPKCTSLTVATVASRSPPGRGKRAERDALELVLGVRREVVVRDAPAARRATPPRRRQTVVSSINEGGRGDELIGLVHQRPENRHAGGVGRSDARPGRGRGQLISMAAMIAAISSLRLEGDVAMLALRQFLALGAQEVEATAPAPRGCRPGR